MVEATPEVEMVDHSEPIVEENKEANPFAQSNNQPRVVLFPKLNSNLSIATMLGYLLTWQQAEAFFACLSKKGRIFFEQNRKGFRFFIDDRSIKPTALTFGSKNAQFLRPQEFARIELLALSNVQKDLHQIELFSQKTKQISQLWLGYRGFKLFERANLEEMIGLNLPFD